MDEFHYRRGILHCEGVPAAEVAKKAGTPCYVYSRATFEQHYRRLAEAFAPACPLLCFSVKCCSNLSILRLLVSMGSGMDVVSGGELLRARRAGCDPSKIVYAGVGKSDAEIKLALQEGIGLFNVESEMEFENLARIAKELGVSTRAALRVNPDVDPKTHRYTTTGKRESKFGVDLERAEAFFARYGADPLVSLRGIHLHIGSPVYTTDPYLESVVKALALIDRLAIGGIAIDTLDLGGGFGADYESDQSPVAAEYATAILPLLVPRVQPSQPAGRTPLKVVLEPGRAIAANAGILLTRVEYVKQSGDRTFAICDAGMHSLLRPSHYGAFHFVWPVAPGEALVPTRRARELVMPGLVRTEVVGPLCETGDFIAEDRLLPSVTRGDLLAVYTAGAYGMTMASRYNSHPLPAEVLVDGSTISIIRRRESYADLIAHEEV
ncbi:MAG: diaminopimelate decarboxylase [Phycisphaerales bacterium]|nr:diaminopimelate decarboxylase [Phycisphaerales bacterium]